ncbi:hypothetical protein FRC18_005719 [Serendipita sp. 400]|nr:hypothetical protein FRC18_005719 [Serendipita sp. 400]
MDSGSEKLADSKKRKRDPSAAPSTTTDVPSPGPIGGDQSGVAAFRSGQALEGLSESAIPLDFAALPTARISKLPTFVPAPNGSRFFLTPDVPVNRSLFRYTPAGASEPGKLVLHRSIENAPATIRVSWEDRSPHIRISQDALAVEGFGGFRSARLNVPVREGKWYVEFHIERSESPDGQSNLGKNVRLGWGRREASLNGPVGLDGYSYGMRDLTGEAVTLSRLKPYGRPFKQGDVVGLYIYLPPKRQPDPDDPYDPAHLVRKRIPIGLKLQPYFEMAEYPVSKEMKALLEEEEKVVPQNTGKKRKVEARPAKGTRTGDQGITRELPILHGSRIAYFVNGECQGIAFNDLYDYHQLREISKRKAAKDRQALNLKERHNPFDDGTLGYYPMVSLYREAIVRVNAGPNFTFPPPTDIDALLENRESSAERQTWRPLCERYDEFVAEMFALDDMEEELAQKAVVNAGLQPVPVEDEKGNQKERKKKRDDTKKKGKKDTGATSRTDTPPVRGNSASIRAQSGTPQPTSSHQGSVPASTPAPQLLDLMDQGTNAESRDASVFNGEESGRSSPAMFKTEEREPSSLRSSVQPSNMKMEIDE